MVIVGDHFNYAIERKVTRHKEHSQGTLVALVDDLVEKNELESAREWLSTQGGHGLISKGWRLDCAIEFWKEGTPLWYAEELRVIGDSMEKCQLIWNEDVWDVVESTFDSVNEVKSLIEAAPSRGNKKAKLG